MAEQPELASVIITTREACQLLDISKSWLKAIAAQGYFTRAGNNAWPVVGLVQGYLRYVQDGARRAVKSAADSRVTDLRAVDLEQRTAARAARLIGRDETVDATREIINVIREEATGAGARIAADAAMAQMIDDEVAEIFGRAEAALDRVAEALRSGTIARGAGRPWNS